MGKKGKPRITMYNVVKKYDKKTIPLMRAGMGYHVR
jgi:hypothetical protein